MDSIALNPADVAIEHWRLVVNSGNRLSCGVPNACSIHSKPLSRACYQQLALSISTLIKLTDNLFLDILRLNKGSIRTSSHLFSETALVKNWVESDFIFKAGFNCTKKGKKYSCFCLANWKAFSQKNRSLLELAAHIFMCLPKACFLLEMFNSNYSNMPISFGLYYLFLICAHTYYSCTCSSLASAGGAHSFRSSSSPKLLPLEPGIGILRTETISHAHFVFLLLSLNCPPPFPFKAWTFLANQMCFPGPITALFLNGFSVCWITSAVPAMETC